MNLYLYENIIQYYITKSFKYMSLKFILDMSLLYSIFNKRYTKQFTELIS